MCVCVCVWMCVCVYVSPHYNHHYGVALIVQSSLTLSPSNSIIHHSRYVPLIASFVTQTVCTSFLVYPNWLVTCRSP